MIVIYRDFGVFGTHQYNLEMLEGRHELSKDLLPNMLEIWELLYLYYNHEETRKLLDAHQWWWSKTLWKDSGNKLHPMYHRLNTRLQSTHPSACCTPSRILIKTIKPCVMD